MNNTISRNEVKVPANVPAEARDTYIDNFLRATHNTGNLMLFAADQKIEHLNRDFVGDGIADEDADPEHMFHIASNSIIGAFAAHHGLISRYANDYKEIPYILKLNAKTDLGGKEFPEPISRQLVECDHIMNLINNGINVVGVGYTIYPGSEHETIMFAEASRIIAEAHNHGLLAVLWMYPRGKSVHNEKDPDLIAGMAGIAVSLGADFVKVNQPSDNGEGKPELLRNTIRAAGRTGVVISGGKAADVGHFLHLTYEQMIIGCRGSATGRNIHQRTLEDAKKMCNAISSIVIGGHDTDYAWKVFTGENNYSLHE